MYGCYDFSKMQIKEVTDKLSFEHLQEVGGDAALWKSGSGVPLGVYNRAWGAKDSGVKGPFLLEWSSSETKTTKGAWHLAGFYSSEYRTYHMMILGKYHLIV